MTDQQKLTALFDGLGIGYKLKTGEDMLSGRDTPNAAAVIRVKEGYKGSLGRVVGYSYFRCDFIFDAAGTLLTVGCWE